VVSSLPETKVPDMELSLPGVKVLESESSSIRPNGGADVVSSDGEFAYI